MKEILFLSNVLITTPFDYLSANIPIEINENNVYDITIPDWVKNIGYWWLGDAISDEDLGNTLNYLIDKKIISFSSDSSEI